MEGINIGEFVRGDFWDSTTGEAFLQGDIVQHPENYGYADLGVKKRYLTPGTDKIPVIGHKTATSNRFYDSDRKLKEKYPIITSEEPPVLVFEVVEDVKLVDSKIELTERVCVIYPNDSNVRWRQVHYEPNIEDEIAENFWWNLKNPNQRDYRLNEQDKEDPEEFLKKELGIERNP